MSLHQRKVRKIFERDPFEDEKDEEQLEREIDFKDAQAEFLRIGEEPWS